MNFAVLTGGGDSAGINDFLYFLAHRLEKEGHHLIGFHQGWLGLTTDQAMEINKINSEDFRFTAGTVLGTARKNPLKDGEIDLVLATLAKRNVDALIVAGGDDTLGVAAHLAQEGLKVVGVPQTIDNDLWGTERTLGFATAVTRAVSSVNSMVNSNIAHDRDMIVEVMGRKAGWIALSTAVNTPAAACMCPEGRMDWDEALQAMERYRRLTGKPALAIVGEGIEMEGFDRSQKAVDAFGNVELRGVGHAVGHKYEELTGRKPRLQILGYILRGGTPVVADVELAATFANHAVDLVLSGRSGEMVSLLGNEPNSIPLKEVLGKTRKVGLDYLENQLKLLA